MLAAEVSEGGTVASGIRTSHGELVTELDDESFESDADCDKYLPISENSSGTDEYQTPKKLKLTSELQGTKDVALLIRKNEVCRDNEKIFKIKEKTARKRAKEYVDEEHCSNGETKSLKKKYDKWQFTLLAWTHVALLVIVASSSMMVKIIFEGLIWVVISVTGVACNDIGAFLCGKIFGRRPLIQVSPKKTWEGFIGAGIITIIYGIVVSTILCKYEYLICPLEYRNISGQITLVSECERSSLFKIKTYSPQFLFGTSITTFPFVLHTFWICLFGSIIAPFGGFFASGFKRAFKVKDFGTVIPGHGGILDRFDCQIFMTTFVNVYIGTFIKEPSVEKIFSRILAMKNEHQIDFFHLLGNYLQGNGLSVNKTDSAVMEL
ncbi:phosphatidate cytidylyltransferase [Holotrichia oblita]|uniref:Phosphatidate cytidylyltransferase n=1 Tax=Holotrichia oblita TaxID=644536 RepID=A0ACB9TFI4_HOLOL|nr:phosphatidate cytidylyltransferase [Holotrichia oblita]